MVHTRVIGQEDIGHETLILVLAVTLNRHRPPEDQGRRGPLRDLAERLAFLGAVNAIEADPLRLAVVQDVNGVAVDDADHRTGERNGFSATEEQKQNEEDDAWRHRKGSDMA